MGRRASDISWRNRCNSSAARFSEGEASRAMQMEDKGLPSRTSTTRSDAADTWTDSAVAAQTSTQIFLICIIPTSLPLNLGLQPNASLNGHAAERALARQLAETRRGT